MLLPRRVGCDVSKKFGGRNWGDAGANHPLHEVHAVPPPSGESFLREHEEARRLALEQARVERKGKTPA